MATRNTAGALSADRPDELAIEAGFYRILIKDVNIS